MAQKKAAAEPFVPDAHHQGILDRVKAAQQEASDKNKERDAAQAKAAKKDAAK